MSLYLSEEWFKARLGKVTASRVSDVCARIKSGYAASRANYMGELIAERLTEKVYERFQSAEMKWGVETEPQARAAYEFYRDETVIESPFVDHPQIEMAGASPDGLVGDDGLIEIKCPMTSTHIESLLWAGTPHRYVHQIQFQLACTGRKWCDFASFDPRMPEELRLFVFRVQRDDKLIGEIEQEIRLFLKELDTKIAQLTHKVLRVA